LIKYLQMENNSNQFFTEKKRSTWVLAILVAVIFSTWLFLTPSGVEGKTRAAGYSVCHQIESHTLVVNDKFLPLCARCTGTFIGVLVGWLYLSSKQKRGGIPSVSKIVLFGVFFLAFVLDGVNSTLSILPGIHPIYTPSNPLRLATGLGFGLVLAVLVKTLWNQTLWKDSSSLPVLISWKQTAGIILILAAIWLFVLSNIPYSFYPIAIFSTLGIFVILTIVYSLLWCIILKRENLLKTFQDGIRIYLAGAISAIVQVGFMDLLRFWLTGTWQGFHL
jgi:uncharacterized membrane protein